MDPPGDFCVHQGTFTFSEVGEAFLLFATIVPDVTAERPSGLVIDSQNTR